MDDNWKKGLARVEFEPPNHFIMVADGKLANSS